MIRIIGIGSPFGADRVGWQVIDELEAMLSNENEYAVGEPELLRLDRPGPGLVNYLSPELSVIIVDALMSDSGYGNVVKLTSDALEREYLPSSSHGLGVKSALDLANALNCLPKKITLYGIEISGDHGEQNVELAPELQDACGRLAALIKAGLRAEPDNRPVTTATAVPDGKIMKKCRGQRRQYE